jgi:putative transposase
MARGVTFALGEFYHLYNRGTDKRVIFKSIRDYDRFVLLLLICNQSRSIQFRLRGIRGLTSDIVNAPRGAPLVDIVGYCLMPNHFHIVAKEITEGGISRFMQKLSTAYTMYFNKSNSRSGALLEATFKARHVSDDRYLKYLIGYVHLNPVKLIDRKWKEDGIKDFPRAQRYLDEYRYSSYPDYAGIKRLENMILNRDALPEYFETPKDFKACTMEWVNGGSMPSEV